MNVKPQFTERKFIINMVFAIGGTIGMLQGIIDGNAYFMLAGVLLGGHALNKFQEYKSGS